MTTEKNRNFISTFKLVYRRLHRFRRKQFWVLLVAMSFEAFVETAAVASIAFFSSAVSDPTSVLTSKYVMFAKQVIDADFLGSARDLIIASGLLMVFLVTLKNSIKAIVNYGIVRFSASIESYFGEVLLNGFLKLPYQWHLTRNTADLVNAIQWRTYLGRGFFDQSLKILNAALMVSILLISLLIVQPMVSFGVIFALGISTYLLYTGIRRKIDKTAALARDYQLVINRDATMSVHGIKDVKISQKEDVFVSKYDKYAVPLAKILAKQNFYVGSPILILETIGFGLIFLAILIMLIKFDVNSARIVGVMTLLAVTAWRVLPAVSQILNSIVAVRKALPFVSNQIAYITIFEADTNTIRRKNADPIVPLSLNSGIKFDKVYFKYQGSDPEVIQDMSFEIKKGETVGIVGTSGAGKSTLVDLLIGLLEPTKGTILVDDQALTNELLPSWLKITGYVPQSPYIFDGTLAENIAFGVDQIDIDRNRVLECCTMASMDDFIDDLTNNIDSLVGERGAKLSGGQQQRIAIARALYDQPEVIIFDEATSSLDKKSEKAIQETIFSLKGKQTLIIIAHNLNTVEDCDKVIWLEKGRIKMVGKPDEVLNAYKLDLESQRVFQIK